MIHKLFHSIGHIENNDLCISYLGKWGRPPVPGSHGSKNFSCPRFTLLPEKLRTLISWSSHLVILEQAIFLVYTEFRVFFYSKMWVFFSAKTGEVPGKPGWVDHCTYQLGRSELTYIKLASFAESVEEISKWGKTKSLERPAGFILQRSESHWWEVWKERGKQPKISRCLLGCILEVTFCRERRVE